VKRRLARWVFRLTRARTRRRFGPEFDALLDEMAEHGDAGFLFLTLDAIRGIGIERWASRTVRHVVVPMVIVAGLTTWAVGQGAAAGDTRDAPVTGLSYGWVLSRPLDLPNGPARRPTACPAIPILSTSMASGVIYSPPTLAPADLWSVGAAGRVYSLDQCSYAIRVAATAVP
jgi:hypothetical protein